MLLCASGLTAQLPSKPGPPKPNRPVKKTPVPNKPPPAVATAKSDLAAGVSVYRGNPQLVVDVIVTNYGPDAISDGQRTVTFTVKNKGNTNIFLKDLKIPALKGTAAIPGKQAGSTFTTSQHLPDFWGFDDNTVYEVRISPSKADPKPSNDVATQVGPNKP